jgi:glutamyl-tRNA synthetase
VNKAGAKFDWDKLDWINSQYLHQMPAEQLTELLVPYWQDAGYEFDPEADRPWLEQLAGLIGPSLARLKDSVDMSRIFFADTVELNEEGKEQLEQPGAIETVNAILEALDPAQPWSDDVAKDIIKRVTKELHVKKGLVMRSLRVAFTGEVHGPDLIQSWGLLHQRGLDRTRLERVLKVDCKEANALSENPAPVEDIKHSQTEADQKPPVSEIPSTEVVAETSAVPSETTQVVETTPTPETPKEEAVVAATPTPETPKEEAVVVATPTPETPKEEAVVAETPTPEIPKENTLEASGLESSTSVDELTTPESEASQDRVQQIGQTIVEILSNLPDYVTTFFSEYQKPLITVGLIVVALVSIKVLVAVLNVFNTIPLVAPILEVVGMAYSLWFVYRYLLKSSTRQELSDQVKSFIEQIAGQNSSIS